MKNYYLLLLVSLLCLFSGGAYAICVKNKTDFQLYYEIRNKNTGCPAPKEKFHSGTLSRKQKNCHAHSSSQGGNDWKIYRNDEITVYKIQNGKKDKVCVKTVTGILNTLKVHYLPTSNPWWCVDRSDDQD